MVLSHNHLRCFLKAQISAPDWMPINQNAFPDHYPGNLIPRSFQCIIRLRNYYFKVPASYQHLNSLPTYVLSTQIFLLLHHPPWLGALYSHISTQSILGDFYVPVLGLGLRLRLLPLPRTLATTIHPHYLACPFNDVGSPRCTAAGDRLPLLPELIQTTLLLTCSPNTSTLILLLSSLASPLWLLILLGFRSQLSDFYKRSRASTSLTAMNQAHRSWKISSSIPVSEGYWTKLDRVGLAGHVPKPVRTQPDMVLMFLKARNLSAVKTTNFNEAK